MDNSVITRVLDQTASLIDAIGDDQWDGRTPCSDWSVRQLVDHLLNDPVQFAQMASGKQADWTAPTRRHDDPAAMFREHADALLAALSRNTGSVPEGLIVGELATHGWDLATAVGRDTSTLDPELAEVGLAFVSANLTPDRRGGAFDAEKQAPPGANAYERLAAFAGREVPFRPER